MRIVGRGLVMGWGEFSYSVSVYDNEGLEGKPIATGNRLLSATITTISDIEIVARTTVTIVAGVLTALTGIEVFLKYSERQTDSRKMQREIEALRDELRFEWFNRVEIEGNMKDRLKAAKELLDDGPDAYNEILNKYVLKGEGGEEPIMNS